MVQRLLLDVQLVDVLPESPDDVVGEAHLLQLFDDDFVVDRDVEPLMAMLDLHSCRRCSS